MNPTLLEKLKALNPTKGEWVDSYGYIESNDTGLFNRIEATVDDCELITLAPEMREELLRMEEVMKAIKLARIKSVVIDTQPHFTPKQIIDKPTP